MGSLYPWSVNNRVQVFFMSGNLVLNTDGKFQKMHSLTLGQVSSQVKDKKPMLTKELRRADVFKTDENSLWKTVLLAAFYFPKCLASVPHIGLSSCKYQNLLTLQLRRILFFSCQLLIIQKALVDQLILNDPDFSKNYFRTQNCYFQSWILEMRFSK